MNVQTDKKNRPIQLTIAWVIAFCTIGYMLPWAIAATRGKSNTGAIAWLNLLLGWTGIGWIIALVMACGSHQVAATQQVIVQQAPPAATPPGWYPSPDGQGQRYWDGAQWTEQSA